MNFTLLSSACGTLFRIDHRWVINLALINKKNEIISSIFSDHNTVRVDANYGGGGIWRLNSTLLNNQQITEEIKKRNQNMHRNE